MPVTLPLKDSCRTTFYCFGAYSAHFSFFRDHRLEFSTSIYRLLQHFGANFGQEIFAADSIQGLVGPPPPPSETPTKLHGAQTRINFSQIAINCISGHQKTIPNHRKPPKTIKKKKQTIKTNQKPRKNIENHQNQSKPIKNHGNHKNPWQTMENHGKPIEKHGKTITNQSLLTSPKSAYCKNKWSHYTILTLLQLENRQVIQYYQAHSIDVTVVILARHTQPSRIDSFFKL